MPTNDQELVLFILDYLIQFVSIAVIFFFTVRYIDKKRGVSHRPQILWLIGLFFLTSSLYDLLNFFDFDYYETMFVGLPKWMIVLRYSFSIFLRIFIIYLSLGVLYFHEQARRLFIAIAIFTIVTVYWKHPYSTFENTAFMAEEAFLGPSNELRFPEFPWISMLVYVTADLLIAGITIYCLTLPNIKALFKK